MTRLTPADLRAIPAGLQDYDRELAARTGCTLCGLACRAAGTGESRLAELARDAPVAVVSLDAGQGVLPGFAEAVRAIAAHLGFPARVTESPDAGGLAEAYRGGARILVGVLHTLKVRGGRYGLACLCGNGGHGGAMVVEVA